MKTEQEKLEAQFKVLSKERNILHDKIEKIKSEQGLPELNRKYLGKYFKTKSRYSSGKSWYIYTYVESIEFPNSFKGRCFETTSDGKRIIDMDLNSYLSCLGKRIGMDEFQKNFDMMMTFLADKMI